MDRFISIPSSYWGVNMSEKKYQKRLEFQQKIISRQSEQIESLKKQIKDLGLESEIKDELIKSVDSLRNDFVRDVDEVKRCKEEYKKLIQELKDMKKILNKEVYNGRWKLVKFLIK